MINLNKKINLTKKPVVNLKKKEVFNSAEWAIIKQRLYITRQVK